MQGESYISVTTEDNSPAPTMTRIRPARHLLLILALIVLLPALFYSAYEISTLSMNERVIAGLYARQLDFILFSMNQHVWDMANIHASSINGLFEEPVGSERFNSALQRFLQRNPAIDAIAVADTLGHDLTLFGRGASGVLRSRIEEVLRRNGEVIDRVNRYKQLEYRRMETIALDDTASTNETLLVIFRLESERFAPRLGGMVVNEPFFIRTVLGPRLRGAIGEEFSAAVLKAPRDSVVFSTDSITAPDLRQRRNLWLLPGYSLGIATRGPTLEELARSRFALNLGLILLLDVILIAGAWMVYRSVRKEMELVRLKSDFISNVSHELRTPLSLIRMFGETLEMGRVRSEEKKHEYYSTIVAETERLTRLVNNILNFSRMEAGRKEYHLAPMNVNDIVADVMKTYGFHLQSEGFAPDLSLDRNLPPIRGDAESISEALINLIDNAVKYSGESRYLRIATGKVNGRVSIDVEDHGIGIAKEHQEKIFETFYRVSTGLIHTVRGTGLGLTLVKHIMEAHGGSVRVESAPGEGSRFSLLFPFHESSGENNG
jgi:two-component system, OmpR family, phosphate regulon sensor histidine kinase PhoR